MEEYTQDKGQHQEGKTLEKDTRRILTGLANPLEVAVKDLGTEADKHPEIVASIRELRAKLQGFTDPKNPDTEVEKELSPEDKERTLSTLKARFEANPHLHEDCDWDRVSSALKANPEALWSINQMEAQGHEPDVYDFDDGGFDIGTCSKETPAGARNCDYDSAVEMADAMGISLMSSAQYQELLQSKGKFDCETWSWLLTDKTTRKSGTALYGNRNDADAVHVSRYPAYNHYSYRAWRGSLRVSWA